MKGLAITVLGAALFAAWVAVLEPGINPLGSGLAFGIAYATGVATTRASYAPIFTALEELADQIREGQRKVDEARKANAARVATLDADKRVIDERLDYATRSLKGGRTQ